MCAGQCAAFVQMAGFMSLVSIASAASRTGVSAKMIRHYERIGLIKPAMRGANHYRQYTETDLHELCFVRRARDLGFSIADIGQLLSLWRDRTRASADVRAIAARHIAELEQKAAALVAMSRSLQHLVAACHGDERPDCPILEALDVFMGGESCCEP